MVMLDLTVVHEDLNIETEGGGECLSQETLVTYMDTNGET